MTSEFQFLNAEKLAQLSVEERMIYFRRAADALQQQINEARAMVAKGQDHVGPAAR